MITFLSSKDDVFGFIDDRVEGSWVGVYLSTDFVLLQHEDRLAAITFDGADAWIDVGSTHEFLHHRSERLISEILGSDFSFPFFEQKINLEPKSVIKNIYEGQYDY